MPLATRVRLLVWLLRLSGVVLILAFPAMLLPVEWMAAAHAWLGLGEFPRLPVVDYLTRSIAALYGFHGVLVLLVSTDPIQHRPFVWYLAVVNVAFGLMLLAIDVHAGMPLWWTAAEGPPIMLMGTALAVLVRGVPSGRNGEAAWIEGVSRSGQRSRAIESRSGG